MNSTKSIFIVAGEKSGDSHAAALIHEIKRFRNEFNFMINGLGGDSMKNEGIRLLYHINELTTSGITGVIKKYKYYKGILKECVEYAKDNKPDIIILTDFPGFNLKFAEEARKFYNEKIIYYISPQVWAWHKSRVHKIKKYIDKMLVVFPFEKEFYMKYGIDAEYVGHPLTKKIKSFLSNYKLKDEAKNRKKTITILPGSRNEEIENHIPALIVLAEKLKNEFHAEVYFHIADSIDKKILEKYKTKLNKFSLSNTDLYELILNSDLVLTKAGTSTVECALIGTPFIIFYKTNPVNFHLIKPFISIKNMGMVNILAGKTIIQEFIQNDFTINKLMQESRKILYDTQYREQMKTNMKKIWNILGDEDASLNAAKIILSYL